MPERGHRRTLLRMSVALVASILGVHRNTVGRWIADGQLHGVAPEDLRAFLRANGWTGRLSKGERPTA